MWNYRVLKQTYKSENKTYTTYDVVEVYYNKVGNPNGYCAASLTEWETLKDLKGTHRLMGLAFKRPVLVLKGKKLVEEK